MSTGQLICTENVSLARDAGVNLAFLSSNSVICHVPLFPSEKGVANRAIRREGWFLPFKKGTPVPKDLLNQKDFTPNMGPDGALLMGARWTPPGRGAGDFTCAKPEHWLFAGTSMKKGDSVKGLIGWEWAGAPMMSLPGMQVLAEGQTLMNKGKQPGHYTATIYDGPKGNIVFNGATIWWANALSSPPGHINPSRHGTKQQGPDKRIQKITHNLFQRINFIEYLIFQIKQNLK